MSFILDALRKSESERQRNAVPGITYGPSGRRRQRAFPWQLIVVVLLLVNLGVLGYFWIRSDVRPTVDEQLATAKIPVEPRSETGTAQSSTGSSSEAGTTTAGDDIRPQVPEASTATAVEPAPVNPVPAKPAPDEPARAEQRPSATAAGKANLPTLARLVLDGVLELPPLHMDVHVFDPDGRSFVSVNGKILRGGSIMKEGPVVEDVTVDGAVMSYRGTRFLLPKD